MSPDSWTLPLAAALLGCLVACVVDQDTAHGLGGRSEEVPAPVPVYVIVWADEPNLGFVNQRCGLEGLARLLLGHAGGGEFPQLVVDEWEEVGPGIRVPGRGSIKELRDVGH